MTSSVFYQLNIVIIIFLSQQKVSSQELYVGCYKNLPGLNSIINTNQSISQCLSQCTNQYYLFSAIKDGSSCYCGNNITIKVPTSNCNLPCKDNNGICGGKDTYSVYISVPTYLGCFKDVQNDRDVETWKITYDSQLTLERCYQACLSSFRFLGLQFAYSCFCGQRYGKHGRALESECDTPCSGNASQMCGGANRNNVYSVGQLPSLNKSYSEIFHCSNGVADMYGTCNTQTCLPGWSGNKCNFRDCLENNGGCGEHKCEKTEVGNQSLSECLCNEGYQSNSIYDECTDINECDLNPCDNNTSVTCNNTIGSFECICRKGFHTNALKQNCTDINECNDYPCDEPSQTCINKDGYFMCVCSSNYNYQPIGGVNQSNCNDNCNLYNCSNFKDCVPIFGYICYGEPDDNSLVGKIVGGILGTILAILVIAGILFLIHRLLYKRKAESPFVVTNNEKGVKIVDVRESTKLVISEVHKYYTNELKKINEQFNNCPKEFDHSQSAAFLPENSSKNRFKKMYPYDYNRVKLHEKPDYINASFIQTYRNPPNVSFIAAQGPKVETCRDFMKMIWDHNVKIIVMLTKCVEDGKDKSHQYWPSEGKLVVDDFTIKVNEKELRLNYQKFTLKVIHNNEERNVIHILYTSWMDKSIPDNVFSLLNLREKMISMIDKDSKNNILVHCSAGVGRTGTFIALDYLLRQAEREGCVDFYECMKFLRNQRCFMIQALSQYQMCYRAMAMFHEIGKSTFISTDNLNSLKTEMENLNDELLTKQFNLIEREVVDITVKDVDKLELRSVNIDAVYVPSSQKTSSYLVGVMPDKFKTECLSEIFENCNIFVLLDSQELDFIPEDQIRFKNRSIQLTAKEETNFCVKYSFRTDDNGEMTYENTNYHDEHPYMNDSPTSILFHITQDVTTTYDLITHLYSILKPNLDIKENWKIIILSRKGYEDAGFLIAALNILQIIDISKEIDIYETVFELRKIQPEICKNIDIYKNLHSFVEYHMSKTILNVGRKTLMEHAYEMPTIDI